MEKPFFDAVRVSLFGGKLLTSQVEGMNDIAAAWRRWGDGDMRKHAYVLATAFWETARTMQPIKEYGSEQYLRSKPYYPYVGRGYVQLTWKENYADWSRRLGVDLVADMDLALDPKYAGRILVEGMMLGTFTGKKLADYINAERTDFKGARRIVNGSDKQNTIADIAAKFLAALEAEAATRPALPALPDWSDPQAVYDYQLAVMRAVGVLKSSA